jgi:hypothetical protein
MEEQRVLAAAAPAQINWVRDSGAADLGGGSIRWVRVRTPFGILPELGRVAQISGISIQTIKVGRASSSAFNRYR